MCTLSNLNFGSWKLPQLWKTGGGILELSCMMSPIFHHQSFTFLWYDRLIYLHRGCPGKFEKLQEAWLATLGLAPLGLVNVQIVIITSILCLMGVALYSCPDLPAMSILQDVFFFFDLF